MFKSLTPLLIVVLMWAFGCSDDPVASPDQCAASTAEDGTVTIDCGSGGTATLAPPEGRPTLLFDTVDATEEECPEGGSVIQVGHDLDEDGQLDAGEIEERIVVCDGKTGPQGYSTLIDVTVEPAGENCPAGGQRIDTVLDLNADEIQETSYVCNAEDGDDGEAGLSALVEISEETPGENCPFGGQRVDTGLDLNDNGELDEDEIMETAYLCERSVRFSGEGILHDLKLDEVTASGWEICHQDLYGEASPNLTRSPTATATTSCLPVERRTPKRSSWLPQTGPPW